MTKTTRKTTAEINSIMGKLEKLYGLSFFDRGKSNPFYVLISTVLSQRATDKVTYKIAPLLFKKYSTPKQFLGANIRDIQRIIRPIGFYKTKAKRIKEISGILASQYNGNVPDTLDELIKLPGVGRKTANCVLVYAFQKQAILVDTHVHRISNRIGIIKTRTPEETEQKLMAAVPRKHWITINELLVRHGQEICRPINPKCTENPQSCPLTCVCHYYKKYIKKQLS